MTHQIPVSSAVLEGATGISWWFPVAPSVAPANANPSADIHLDRTWSAVFGCLHQAPGGRVGVI